MRRSHRTTAGLTLLLLASVTGLAACSSSGPARLDTATAGVAETNRVLLSGRDNVNRVVTTMNALQPGDGLPRSFRTFSTSIDDLDRTAERVRARNAAMQTRARDHLRAWERELLETSGAGARELGEQRRAAFASRFEYLQQKMNALSNVFDPFMADLNDLRLILANDLNASGLQAAAPLMDQVKANAKRVTAAVEEASSALVAVESEISPRSAR